MEEGEEEERRNVAGAVSRVRRGATKKWGVPRTTIKRPPLSSVLVNRGKNVAPAPFTGRGSHETEQTEPGLSLRRDPEKPPNDLAARTRASRRVFSTTNGYPGANKDSELFVRSPRFGFELIRLNAPRACAVMYRRSSSRLCLGLLSLPFSSFPSPFLGFLRWLGQRLGRGQ